MALSGRPPLARLVPNLNEPIHGPSHDVGDLPIANFDDALNAIRPARHVHTEEWAWNRLRAIGHGFRDGRVWLGGEWRSIQDEVPPLGTGYKVLDTTDAKAALDETPVLFHFRDHCLDLLWVFNNGTDGSLQRFGVVFDEESFPPESPQLAYQIVGSVEENSLRRIVFDYSIPVRQMVCCDVLLGRCEAKTVSPFDRRGEVDVFNMSEHPASIDHTSARLERRPDAGRACIQSLGVN